MIDNDYSDEDYSVSEESFISVIDNNEIYDNDETRSEWEEGDEGEDDDYVDDDYDDSDYDGEDDQSDGFDEEEYSDENEGQNIEAEGSLGAVINNRRRDEQDTVNGTTGLYSRTYTNGPIDYDVYGTLNADDYVDVMRISPSVLEDQHQTIIDTLRVFVDWPSEIYEDYEIGSEIHVEENEDEHIELIEPIDALFGPDDEV